MMVDGINTNSVNLYATTQTTPDRRADEAESSRQFQADEAERTSAATTGTGGAQSLPFNPNLGRNLNITV